MNKLNSSALSVVITVLLIVVVIVSSLVTTNIVQQLEAEEQKKIELWAEATRLFSLADEDDNVDLIFECGALLRYHPFQASFDP